MRVAIIGAGIAGLTTAHLLHDRAQITVFEAADYAGGHTNTIRVDLPDETHYVDTGFIVFNDRNYPGFERLLGSLGVAWQPSEMSFSVADEHGAFEYNGSSPNGLFATRSNLLSPSFYRMIADLVRFNRRARSLLNGPMAAPPPGFPAAPPSGFPAAPPPGFPAAPPAGSNAVDARAQDGPSLGEWLEAEGFSETFIRRLIVPQASAVWSADPAQMWSFPARFLAEFFDNHGMLGLGGRPSWRTVVGGSFRYVEAITARWRERLRLGTPVVSVQRAPDHVLVTPRGGAPERFDHVVIATHSDQALALLADASERERELLAAIPYQPNEAVLHTDRRLLPRRRRAWASWNFHLLDQPKTATTVTYHMNRLQSLRAQRELCVTLNRTEAIDPAQIIRVIPYAHPVYTREGVRAQARLHEISGVNRTHFAGAWTGWGFHEDGVRSAQRVAADFGATL